ncbi:MAG: trypsin-like peptidase domain-containing protein [Prevotella sp.]
MKSVFLSLLFTCFALGAQAQSANVQKVLKSVFSLTTFKKDGSLLASGRGVFVGTNGEAVSTWAPFVGADSAIVIDANGNKHTVDVIYGASEVYDLCKFKVNAITTPAPAAKTQMAVGARAWLVQYSTGRAQTSALKVKKAEPFMTDCYFYQYDGQPENIHVGCPVTNEKGEVMGLLQQSKLSGDYNSVDVRFAETFKTTGLSVNEPILKQTTIRMALPDKQDQALLMLMLEAGQTSPSRYLRYVEDFIHKFPKSVEGYVSKAEFYLAQNDFGKANATMQTALSMADKKDEAHYNLAKLIYQKEIKQANMPYPQWNLDLALAETNKAYALNPLPLYKHLEAQIVYFKGEYAKAYEQFMALTKTNLRNGELFYEAAQCKQQLKAPFAEILTLLDSAVTAQDANLSAPYVLARGTALHGAQQYKKAMADYNRYDSLMLGRASHDFYYTRALCEVQLRQFQQALNDFAHAIVLNRAEPTYYAELAQLQLRVNQKDDAVATADLGLRIAPNYPDLYLIKGLALVNDNKKAEGLAALNKAKELGDTRADDLIKKYK